MNLNENNVVCHCSDVTVGNILENIQTNPNFSTMSFDDKLEHLDIAQRCGRCEDYDYEGIDTHYGDVLK